MAVQASPATCEFVLEVLAIFDRCDCHSGLFWRVNQFPGEGLKLFANCSDLFHWATADAEEIASDDLPLLRQCESDLAVIGEEQWIEDLYAARKRGMRPQRPCYKHLPETTHVLFDACGPERDPKGEG